jgi:hypothetical protein
MTLKLLRSLAALPVSRFVPPLVLSLALPACPKDEPPPPLPAPATVVAPPPAPAMTIEPEPTATTSASTTPSSGPRVAAPSMKRCCDALAQNSKSAPPPNSTFLLQAAQACSAAVAAGSAAPAVLGAVRAALGSAPMPLGCQ